MVTVRKKIELKEDDGIYVDGERVESLIIEEGVTYVFDAPNLYFFRSIESPQDIVANGSNTYAINNSSLIYKKKQEEDPHLYHLSKVVDDPSKYSLFKEDEAFETRRLLVVQGDVRQYDYDYRLSDDHTSVVFNYNVSSDFQVYTNLYEHANYDNGKIVLRVPSGFTKRGLYLSDLSLNNIPISIVSNTSSHNYEREIPDYIRVKYPQFSAFLRTYWEYLSRKGKAQEFVSNLLSYVDVDDTLDAFITKFKKTYAENIPFGLVNERLFLKNILQFYEERGTERSFKFMLRVLFNIDSRISYPDDQIIRASGGKWVQHKIIQVDNAEVAHWAQKQIIGPNGTAVVEFVVPRNTSSELYVSNITGTFAIDDIVSCDADEAKIVPSIVSVELRNCDDTSVTYNTAITENSASGSGAKFFISLIANNTLKRVGVLRQGSGYEEGDTMTIGSCEAEIIIGPIGQLHGFFENDDGFLSGSNVIQDNWFYQLYSYCINSEIEQVNYESAITKTVHVSGTKQFGNVILPPAVIIAAVPNLPPNAEWTVKFGNHEKQLYTKDFKYGVSYKKWKKGEAYSVGDIILTESFKVFQCTSASEFSIYEPDIIAFTGFSNSLDQYGWVFLYTLNEEEKYFITDEYIPYKTVWGENNYSASRLSSLLNPVNVEPVIMILAKKMYNELPELVSYDQIELYMDGIKFGNTIQLPNEIKTNKTQNEFHRILISDI